MYNFFFRIILLISSSQFLFANPTGLIINTDNRTITNLKGEWNTIIDPFDNGYFTYRYEVNKNGFFKNQKMKSPRDLIEYDFDKSKTLHVPSDWNTQRDDLFFYEGSIWYKKSFDYDLPEDKRLFVYFGGANYHSIVYLNGTKLGEHTGGFTPFNFEITDLVKEEDNFLIVKVDNKRHRGGVPTLNTDWWNYGGLTRQVKIVETASTFIRDYFIQLKNGSDKHIEGWIQLDGEQKEQNVTVSIKEDGVSHSVRTNSQGLARFTFPAQPVLWSPTNPKLYNVEILSKTDKISDQIGFRTISTKDSQILLNGNPIFLCGISIHEEALKKKGRSNSREDARALLAAAKELGCNFVRLAHYPHNEFMLKEADKMGLLVWSEIPVYWTILWDNPETYLNAEQQLEEMIQRDKNRAAVVIWSMANETPRGSARMSFLTSLISKAKELDNTRLVSAATEVSSKNGYTVIDDPLIDYLDVIGVNEYHGWYGGKPEDTPKMKWKTTVTKPLIMTEFGGGAKFGHHGKKEERWTEEYQEYLYQQQLKMLSKISFLRGMSPWILKDFLSPRRPLPVIQDYYNRKGLLSENGDKKKAWFVLNKYYQSRQMSAQ